MKLLRPGGSERGGDLPGGGAADRTVQELSQETPAGALLLPQSLSLCFLSASSDDLASRPSQLKAVQKILGGEGRHSPGQVHHGLQDVVTQRSTALSKGDPSSCSQIDGGTGAWRRPRESGGSPCRKPDHQTVPSRTSQSPPQQERQPVSVSSRSPWSKPCLSAHCLSALAGQGVKSAT